MERIKNWFSSNWVWIILFLSMLSTFLVWLLFRKQGESAPALRMPGKAEVEAALEERRLRKEREDQENKATSERKKEIGQIEKELKEKNKQSDELQTKTEKEIGDELDRRL